MSLIRPLRKLLSLKPDERRLIARAYSLLVFSRLILWIAPYGVVHRKLSSPGRARRKSGGHNLQECMGAIERAARWVPAATCLTQSMAGRWLLAREGIEARVCFGARRGADGQFEAHAWLESDGKVVGMEPPGRPFSPLPPVNQG